MLEYRRCSIENLVGRDELIVLRGWHITREEKLDSPLSLFLALCCNSIPFFVTLAFNKLYFVTSQTLPFIINPSKDAWSLKSECNSKHVFILDSLKSTMPSSRLSCFWSDIWLNLNVVRIGEEVGVFLRNEDRGWWSLICRNVSAYPELCYGFPFEFLVLFPLSSSKKQDLKRYMSSSSLMSLCRKELFPCFWRRGELLLLHFSWQF